MFFCTFSTSAQKVFKGWGCNFTWSFSKVMRIKSSKMMLVARIIRYKLCTIYAFFDSFVQKSFLTKNYLLIAEIDFTTRGPLYTCLVDFKSESIKFSKLFLRSNYESPLAWSRKIWFPSPLKNHYSASQNFPSHLPQIISKLLSHRQSRVEILCF